MSGPDAALAVCRVLHDTAAMLLWGACGFLATLVPRDLGRAVDRRLAAGRVAAIAVAVLTTALALPIEVAAIASGWRDALDPATVRAVLVETSAGTAWQAQAVAALLLAATLLAPAPSRIGATAAASGLLLATLALTGHAAMQGGWPGVAHRLNDAVHVLAGGAWFGALVPLLPLLGALGDPRHHRDAGVALRHFSTAGHGAVALVIATGAINTALVLGHWPLDWSLPYQALLAAKIALVAVMTALALANRYILVPRLACGPVQTIRALRRATLVEIALGVAVIGCVGLFGLLDPG